MGVESWWPCGYDFHIIDQLVIQIAVWQRSRLPHWLWHFASRLLGSPLSIIWFLNKHLMLLDPLDVMLCYLMFTMIKLWSGNIMETPFYDSLCISLFQFILRKVIGLELNWTRDTYYIFCNRVQVFLISVADVEK